MNGKEEGEGQGWPGTYSENRKCNEDGRWKEANDEGEMGGGEREDRRKKSRKINEIDEKRTGNEARAGGGKRSTTRTGWEGKEREYG